MKKIINYFTLPHWAILILMLVANYIAGGLSEPIGAICSITGVLCVILVAKGKLSNFFFGVINVTLYIYIAYNASLFGEVMLNSLYYLPSQFVGFYLWKKRMTETGVVQAKTMTLKQMTILVGVSVIGIYAYGLFLTSLDGATPMLDSTSTVLSVIAQILMLACFAEQWLLWIVINIVSVAMWLIPAMQGDVTAWSMVVMWGAYLLNAIYGYFLWKKQANNISHKGQNVVDFGGE